MVRREPLRKQSARARTQSSLTPPRDPPSYNAQVNSTSGLNGAACQRWCRTLLYGDKASFDGGYCLTLGPGLPDNTVQSFPGRRRQTLFALQGMNATVPTLLLANRPCGWPRAQTLHPGSHQEPCPLHRQPGEDTGPRLCPLQPPWPLLHKL